MLLVAATGRKTPTLFVCAAVLVLAAVGVIMWTLYANFGGVAANRTMDGSCFPHKAITPLSQGLCINCILSAAGAQDLDVEQ